MKPLNLVIVGEHQLLLSESLFSELALAAQVMVAAARALPSCSSGVYSLLRPPPRAREAVGKLAGQIKQEVM
jgi:hypothetical protein